MIKISNVSKAYNGQNVLKGLTLNVKKGDRLCIMGRSGAGKTTLINLILGLEKPDSGSIEMQDNIGFSCVFQENRLVEALSAEKNIQLACGNIDIISAAQKIGLSEQDLVKPVFELSGGQKRRAAILRAMLHKSEVVIFDEAMQGLDDITQQEVARFVLESIGERALIAITHSLDEASGYGAEIFEIL